MTGDAAASPARRERARLWLISAAGVHLDHITVAMLDSLEALLAAETAGLSVSAASESQEKVR